MATHASNAKILAHEEKLQLIGDAIGVALDTDPLLLRDALEAVLSRSTSLRTNDEGEPSLVGAAIGAQYMLDVAKALGVKW